MSRPLRIGERIQSFRYAWNGIRDLVRSQPNARLHLVSTVLVISLGLWKEVTPTEWCLLTLALGQVWAAEALNTAVEYLADAVTLEQNPLIGRAKDVAAGAVLIAATSSAVIGVIVFLPII